jgi:hypothetical protein
LHLLDGWPDRDEAALRFRCARRAVAAALRAERSPAVRVAGADRPTGAVTVAAGEEYWQAWTARDGDVIVAWTLGERVQP